MKIKTLLLAGALALGLGSGAYAKTFHFAFQGEVKSLDPYTLNETFTYSVLGNVYEGIITRGPNLEILPGLAEKWELVSPTHWRFTLRKGVKFHNGDPLTTDDVLFSADRIRNTASDMKLRVPADAEFKKVDDLTFDVMLKAPNPILPNEWETFFIMNKKWAEANNSKDPQPASATTPSYASLNANGTGPFIIESHQAGVKTVFKPNKDWWGKKEHNLDEVVFTPIKSAATRVAALLSGEVDWIDPVPLQDFDRVDNSGVAKVMAGEETRVIYLGFDQSSDELKYSDVKGKNPFKDIKVRQAFYQAVDINAIKEKVMRNRAYPTGAMISKFYFSGANKLERLKYDPEGAKKLLADAGYPNGFSITLDCPNDRYVNDEAICQAVVSMLARINIKASLNSQTKSKYFAKILEAGNYDTSFFMLGWSPGSMDSLNPLSNLIACRNKEKKVGATNVGGYCNPKVDELTAKIKGETDTAKRDAMIAEAFKIVNDDVAHIPLHTQSLAWGVSKNVEIVQRADNFIKFNWVTKK